MMPLFAYLFLLFSVAACSTMGNEAAQSPRNIDFDAFGDYWYQGKAELNAYDLEQYRYGEKRSGEAVLIFVTEDFSREKQVKLDNPQQHEADAQKVLKLNMTKNFLTGVYPYSMMLSTFTPIYDQEPAVKVTASVQEWCGQTFSQLNWQAGQYKAQLHSYFEQEGDRQLTLDARSEDGIWNLIRLNPKEVPIGELQLVPGLLDLRFTHIPFAAYNATVAITPAGQAVGGFAAEKLSICNISYSNYPRTLRIFFTNIFPYEIVGWEEVRKLENGQQEISRAIRKAVMLQDYWTKNGNRFQPLRKELRLQQ